MHVCLCDVDHIDARRAAAEGDGRPGTAVQHAVCRVPCEAQKKTPTREALDTAYVDMMAFGDLNMAAPLH